VKIDVTKMLIALGEQEMSIKELSKRSGISRTTLSAIKAGKTCRPDIAGRIAKAINRSLTDLIENK
jgi:DNA-binding Xre family transcriptional regulator